MPGEPDPPLGLIAVSSDKGDEAMCEWLDPRVNGAPVEMYRVEIVREEDGFLLHAAEEVDGGTNYACLGGLYNNTYYLIRIAARNRIGWGDWSSPAVRMLTVTLPPAKPEPVAMKVSSWCMPSVFFFRACDGAPDKCYAVDRAAASVHRLMC
jgi:hypothetical protein